MTDSLPRTRAEAFAGRLGIGSPILLAPMAGACPVGLSAALAHAGGMGGSVGPKLGELVVGRRFCFNALA